ncbi:MAG: rod-binding protein [Pseudomonadota bacterium]
MFTEGAMMERPRAYTDLGGLQSISRTGREDTAEGLRQVAEQFEALFLNIMLKEMRGAGESLFEDNYLRGNEMEIHQENFDNQISMELSSSGGIGLADTLYRQLARRYQVDSQPGAAAAAYREVSRHEPD